ncbi:MAG: DUF4325 domain-containing protein, partial [Calditrichae bacterium]|nr:DUF4325 domain-containing protein [Calditrichia bacterium]
MPLKEIIVKIFEQIGSTAAVASDDGEQIYSRIQKALNNDLIVRLDFKNIELITSSFLNAAIGQLYNSFESQFLREHLKVEN